MCFCNVNFPSKDALTKAADDALWKYTIYATLQDGSITETVLGVKIPLEAGQFKLIRGKVEPNGSVMPREPYVGASVTLQWNDGTAWDVDI